MKINVLFEDNHVLVVEKPVNIPVQEDDSKDEDLLTILKQYLKDKYQKPGNVYLGLVHRLDRPVGGVMYLRKQVKLLQDYPNKYKNAPCIRFIMQLLVMVLWKENKHSKTIYGKTKRPIVYKLYQKVIQKENMQYCTMNFLHQRIIYH